MFINNWFKTLYQRLLILLLVFGTVPLAVAGFILIQMERETLLNQSERELNGVASATARNLDNYLHELLLDSRSIALLPDIRSMDPARQQAVLEQLLPLYDRYGQLAIIDLSGQILLTGRPQETVNISQIESFDNAAGGTQSWYVAPGLFNEDLVLHMHTPILGEDGRPMAVLGSPVPLSNLAAIVSLENKTSGYEIFVLGADQRVLIHPDLEKQLARESFAGFVGKEAEADLGLATLPDLERDHLVTDSELPGLTSSFTRNGEEFLAIHKPMYHLEWAIVVSQPMANILALTSATSVVAMGGILLTMMIGSLMAIIFARRLANPISRLAEAAHALRGGDPLAPLPDTAGQDEELQVLIEAFAVMREAVTLRETELRELSLNLEQRVKSRTIELQRTNRKLAEEVDRHKETLVQLELAKDSAEAASRMKSVFMATMSHELRTPLTAIIGFAEILKEEAAFVEDSVALDDLNSILNSAHELLQIINDVLNLARIEAGGLELNKGPVNMPQIVNDAVRQLQPLLTQNDNQLEIAITPELSHDFLGDETKIYQILWNLLSNAAKFTHQGRIDLCLTVDRELPFLDNSAHWMVISVADTGIGIPHDKQPALFEPFIQADGSKNRRYSGTGLGLALSRRLCQILGGEIFFESRLHHGSTFTVRLPIQHERVKQV